MLWPPEPPVRIMGVGENLFTERELLPEQSLGLPPPHPAPAPRHTGGRNVRARLLHLPRHTRHVGAGHWTPTQY